MTKEKITLTKNEIIRLTKSGYFSALQDMLGCDFNDNLRRLFFYVAALGGKPTISRDVDIDELLEFGFDEIINDEFRLSVEPIETYSGSWGEVKNSEAINHLIDKPMADGLFCERIFGTNAHFRYGHVDVSADFSNLIFPKLRLNQVLVIPTDMRPIVKSAKGEWIISGTNEAYRRIVMRNNRAKKLMSLNAPQILINNEHRMLRDAISDLVEGDPTKYKSISSEMLRLLYDTVFNNKIDPCVYEQKTSEPPIRLDGARIAEFESCLNFLDGAINLTPQNKKDYLLQAINYVNTSDDFANSLIFCLLSGRRATVEERNAIMQEFAKRPNPQRCKTPRPEPIVEPAESNDAFFATSSVTYKEPFDEEEDDIDEDIDEILADLLDDDDDEDN